MLKGNPQLQEKIADGLSGGSLTVGISMSIADYNAYMEAATLTIGLIAGIFALFFHVRRWLNTRAAARQKIKDTAQAAAEAAVEQYVARQEENQ